MVKAWSILGNSQLLDGGAMFGNAPRAMWEQWHKPDEFGRIALVCRALLLEIEGKKILCEAGIGTYMEPKLKERFGVVEREHMLLENLKAMGLNPSDIDIVILSHLHFDHAGGLLAPYDEKAGGKLQLLFDQAEYYVSREHFERSEHPHLRDRASFIPGLSQLLQSTGRLKLVDGERHPDLPEAISFFYSSGHTPSQMHAVVKGAKHTIVFLGDLVPGVSWIHLPITMGYDRYPELVIEEKKKLFETFEGSDWLGFYTHDPMYSHSVIQKNAKGRYEGLTNYSKMEALEV